MTETKKHELRIILILGALSTLTPFAIDLYLPAFPEIAAGLGSTEAQVALSLSSYFIGMAVGQLFYGPLLDRFGRKKPLSTWGSVCSCSPPSAAPQRRMSRH
jgi:MFS transporter, DHA1 family, multidrug resistance protein